MGEVGFGVAERSPEEIRAMIYTAEAGFAGDGFHDMVQIPLIPAEHMFVPGLYFRCFKMAKDTFLTGKLHANNDGLIVAQGKVTFITEHGTRTLEGPCMTTVLANTKPLLYAHTDVVFYSAHLNLDNSRDMELIESRVVTHNQAGRQNREVLR